MYEIMVVIPTCNRLSVVKQMAASFYLSDIGNNVHIYIYDDASKEYSVEELNKLFPTAKIIRHPNNLGADLNMWYMYNDFANSQYDILFNADSDLIFHKSWQSAIEKLFSQTEGVLSLFNTSKHNEISNVGELTQKSNIGAAGTVISKEIVIDIIKNIRRDDVKFFDHQWCEYLNKRNIKIYATTKSYVQHIGLCGHNSSILGFDYGDNFEVDSTLNGQIINDVLEKYYINFTKDNFIDASLDYKLGYYILKPLRMLKKIMVNLK